MSTRRYVIEASIRTLTRFTAILNKRDNRDCFVHRVSANSTDEHYIIVVTATDELHRDLRGPFPNSTPVRSPR